MSSDYEALSTYYDDLLKRTRDRERWIVRHPDWGSAAFHADTDAYFAWLENPQGQIGPPPTTSTFDPNDEAPQTNDLFTSGRLLTIMRVAIEAWEASHQAPNERREP